MGSIVAESLVAICKVLAVVLMQDAGWCSWLRQANVGMRRGCIARVFCTCRAMGAGLASSIATDIQMRWQDETDSTWMKLVSRARNKAQKMS